MQGSISNDSFSDNVQTGFRLHRMEILNWGTFNKKVWKIEPKGSNSLLTGEIGSGKSTLIDAITTLLVPPNKIVYNKAAGAVRRERNLLSYVQGGYRNKKCESDDRSETIYLRSENDYSVLLSYFYNAGFDQKATLAQVFWHKSGDIGRFFVISSQDLNINEHFQINPEEKDVFQLKKRLKRLTNVWIFESFSEYSSKFRSIFGIKSEEALDLFNKTVSLKSVEDLTEFVRESMLDRPNVSEKIEELKRNYENLTKAYDAVQKAKRQMQQLQPLIKEADEFEKIRDDIQNLQKCLDALQAYFAVQKDSLLQKEIKSLNNDIEIIKNKIEEIKTYLQQLRKKETDIKIAFETNKEGQRLKEIINNLHQLEINKESKFKKDKEHSILLESLELPKVMAEKGFYETRENAETLKNDIEKRKSSLTDDRDSLVLQRNELTNARNSFNIELTSLRKRETQIPNEYLEIREMITSDLGIPKSELPFVGELLKVKDNERAWEGAIERVLHPFGLSMLVSEKHYKQISSYADRTYLKRKRLQYFKVSSTFKYEALKEIPSNALPKKVEIKTDSVFYEWLEDSLSKRFNYICCDTIEQFQREPRAVTLNGQIKSGNIKHIKDDRREINDRTFYILGWSNKEKIKAIETKLLENLAKLDGIDNKKKVIEGQIKQLDTRSVYLHDLLRFKDYNEINWQKEVVEIQKLQTEKEELEKSSDKLLSLRNQLESVQLEISEVEENLESEQNENGKIESLIVIYGNQLKECQLILSNISFEEHKASFSRIQTFLKDTNFKIGAIDNLQYDTRKYIETLRDERIRSSEKLLTNIISKMRKYKEDYPSETTEVDTSVEAIPEFRSMLKKIEEDDLPKHADNFRKLLKEGTIRDIAIFRTQLGADAMNIENKIKKINKSLAEIEYDSGTYIELQAEKVRDYDIQEFQTQLRDCMADTLGEIGQQDEERFNRVKKILDKFNSGDPIYINWTTKVTDVRNWFRFSASEKYKEDGIEKEFYSDSSGKSGGQKEKLAYTILASALAYQFSLEWNQAKSKSFKFVSIDEAFGRGSDESTRYGLRLFNKLNLQLLIVTPLQKLNIIENYVNTVHYIVKQNSEESVIKIMTMEEYFEEKAKALGKDETSPPIQTRALVQTNPQLLVESSPSIPQEIQVQTEPDNTANTMNNAVTQHSDLVQIKNQDNNKVQNSNRT